MKKTLLWFLWALLCSTVAVAQTQITGSAVQIGGGVPNVTSIQGQSGDFTFTGPGFSDCTVTGAGTSTCTFNGGSGTGTSGQCQLGSGALVGAYTDGSGVVKSALCLGNGPTSYTVPTGATQLQLGINENKFVDNTGSLVVNISKNGGAASPVTIGATVMPWSSPSNPSFTYGLDDGASPVVALTGLIAGDIVTVTYSSGTVSVNPPTAPNSDANGWLTIPPGAACNGGPTGSFQCGGFGFTPTNYMGLATSSGTAITALTGDVTAAGPGSAVATVGGINGVPLCTGFSPTSGQALVYTTALSPNPCYTAALSAGSVSGQGANVVPLATGATAIGAQSHINESTAGTTQVTQKLGINDGSGQGGTFDATEGTAATAAAGHDILYADSTAHCLKYSANNGAFACLGAAAGTVTTTGSPASGNLTKFSGASSITNADLTGDVTTSGTMATTLATVNSGPGACGDATHVCQVTTNGKGLTTAQTAVAITAGGSAITALTGDGTAAGPGSAALTLATVNSNVGSCGDATHVGQVTLDAKGRTTACTAVAISGSGTRAWQCQPGLGDGVNPVPATTYPQSVCVNTTGSTVTLTGFQCFTDNNGSSTVNVTNGSSTALLTGAITCTTTFASGTQSGTTTLANGDYLKFSFVADGTTKQSTWVAKGTY